MDTEFANSVSIIESENGDFAKLAIPMTSYRPDDGVFIQRCGHMNRNFVCSNLEAAILGGIEGLA